MTATGFPRVVAALLCGVLPGAVVVCTEAASPLTMVVEGSKSPRPEVYLQGEPPSGPIIITNTSSQPLKVTYDAAPTFAELGRRTGWALHLKGEAAGPICSIIAETSVLLAEPFVTTLAPSEVVVRQWGSARPLGPGRYEVWVTYDPLAAGLGWFLDKEGLPPLRVESNHLHFEVVAATGLDAEAFEKYGRDNPCTTWWNGTWGQKVVADYPTSVYAGWALLSSSYFSCQVPSWDVESGWSPDRPPSAALLEELRTRQQEQNEGMTRHALAAVEQLRDYLARRPDFPDADWMRQVIACNKLTAGDVQGARSMLEALLRKDDLPYRLREHTEAALAKVDEATGRQ